MSTTQNRLEGPRSLAWHKHFKRRKITSFDLSIYVFKDNQYVNLQKKYNFPSSEVFLDQLEFYIGWRFTYLQLEIYITSIFF